MTNEEFIESIRLEGEEFRPVVGWEDSYMVSSFGRIVSLGRFKPFSNRKGCYTKPQIKIQTLGFGNDSYYVVQLNCKSKRKTYKTHRLVAMAFISNPNNYPEVDHINRDTKDNKVCNLRWCTHKMNMNNENSVANFSSIRKGKPNKANRKSVVCIKDGVVVKTYDYVIETEKDGFIPTAVSRVCLGKSKSHHGYTWVHLSDFLSCQNSDVKELSPMQ